VETAVLAVIVLVVLVVIGPLLICQAMPRLHRAVVGAQARLAATRPAGEE
jgi:hypothetical protein